MATDSGVLVTVYVEHEQLIIKDMPRFVSFSGNCEERRAGRIHQVT